jgi:CDP-6-deoxy-D-xylo-4-hexulose-3-dehydrase
MTIMANKVYYANAVYGKEEINAVNKVLKNHLTLMDGPLVKEFEIKVAKIFGKKYGIMVNSGSSANLIALASLDLSKGGEVITPALTFATTVAPIYQCGLIPHFVDVEHAEFITNPQYIASALTNKTVAIMVPNLLGNVCNWERIYNFAKQHGLKVIEDCADTIGYKYYDSKDGTTGKYNDLVTTSFYASHIITAGGQGGMVCTNDKKLVGKLKLLRGWGRSSAVFNESEAIERRFNTKVDGIDYDSKFIFTDIGYNFLPSEISAAFGLEQLKKLSKYKKIRQKNFEALRDFFMPYCEMRWVRRVGWGTHADTPWLAYPLVLDDHAPFTRKQMQIHFEKNGVQVRTIFTGNITRQPVMKNMKWKGNKEFSVADDVMKNGMLIGAHQGMGDKEINRIKEVFTSLAKKYK